jgi:phosphoserine phosphatase RsbU/P
MAPASMGAAPNFCHGVLPNPCYSSLVIPLKREVRRGLEDLARRNPIGRKAREAENAEARALQRSLLPEGAPRSDGFDIAFAWQPSAEVSGDYFDVFPLPGGRIALCIADVSGKGLAAAQFARALRSAVHAHGPGAAMPADLCTQVNKTLSAGATPGRYATLFYGVLDPGDHSLHYENAGHCLPLLVRADGSVEFPASFSGVLGLFSHWLYQNQQTQLGTGDTLLLLTDGILEAEGRRGAEFGYQRLIALVQQAREASAAALGQQILAAVARHAGGNLRDDASLIVVRAQ